MKKTKKRIKTPTYILTLKLKTNAYEEAILNKRFEIGRKLYNAVLGLALKRYNSLTERKEYRKLKKTIIETNKKIKNTKDKNKIKELKIEQNKLYKEIKTLYKEFNLTEYGLINTMTPLYKPFNKNIDNKTAQAIASRAWKAIDKLINGNGKKVYFKKYNELNSLEGKWNKSGMKYDGQGNVKWNKLKIPVIIKNTDTYAQKAIKDKVKYIRIIRKTIRGKNKYYVQIILEGIPPNKNRNKNKKETGTVGIDIGTQTIAIVSDKQVKLLELAPEVNVIYKKEKILQRKLDRQRRSNNPNNYNEDGTIKRGIKLNWKKSNKYKKTQNKLKEIKRKQKVLRKQSHEKLANFIITLGDTIKVEEMNFKGLQRRSKKTTINKKTGKYNKKKRYGKSLANKAPAMILSIIERKLKYNDQELIKINTREVKASQYNHIEDENQKKPLSERWNIIGDNKIQRDLYSAYIIKNVNIEDRKTINREKMIEEFENFNKLHKKEIERLENLKKRKHKLISSFGI